MFKHTQTIRWRFADELFTAFDHFMKLALKGVKLIFENIKCMEMKHVTKGMDVPN